jgi:hypothetical protein
LSAAAPATGLEGVITVGPVHGGPTRIGVPDSRPLANTAFIAKNQEGNVVSIRRYGPFEADVTAGPNDESRMALRHWDALKSVLCRPERSEAQPKDF